MISLNRLKFLTRKNNSSIKNLKQLNLQFKNLSQSVKSLNEYEKNYKESVENPESYWGAKQNLIEWYEKPKLILDKKNILKNYW